MEKVGSFDFISILLIDIFSLSFAHIRSRLPTFSSLFLSLCVSLSLHLILIFNSFCLWFSFVLVSPRSSLSYWFFTLFLYSHSHYRSSPVIFLVFLCSFSSPTLPPKVLLFFFFIRACVCPYSLSHLLLNCLCFVFYLHATLSVSFFIILLA